MHVDLQQLRQTLEHDPGPSTPERSDFVHDSVMLLLVDRRDTRLVAVQKADSEGYHWRNQLALPGGRIDSTDHDATAAALRELEEELGIHRDCVDVLGYLGRFQTQTSHHELEVIVGQWRQPCPLKIDAREIARAFELPLTDLLKLHTSQGFRRRPADNIGETLVYPIQGVSIWGVTARILHYFLELIAKSELCVP
jgi:coenzyme A diphosphatase NUDT7